MVGEKVEAKEGKKEKERLLFLSPFFIFEI